MWIELLVYDHVKKDQQGHNQNEQETELNHIDLSNKTHLFSFIY